MSWKNYFFFQKNDKIAITVLLILIIISGIGYVITLPSNKPYTGNTFEAEFEAFQSALRDKDSTSYSDNKVYNGQQNKESQTGYIHSVKLSKGETVELNSADTTELKKIPGIGSGYANRIVKYRTLLGGYADITQLKEVWGMDDELYDKITTYITLVPAAKKIRINSASFEELNGHPYISYKQAKVITDIRERKGNIESINRLSLLEEFTANDIRRLTPYLSFN
jgi:competence ComEA-like helix-hairpin-helix protein